MSKSKRRDIAVKIINKKKSPKDILTKFLPREIETLKAIEHENVVQLYEVIETEDAIYLMMEYVEGGFHTVWCSRAVYQKKSKI